jgi:hypothetical protein
MKTRHAAIVISVAALALPVLVATPVAASSTGFSRVHNAKATGTTVTPFESPAVAPSGHAPLPARLAAPGGTPSRASGTLGSRSADPRIQTPTNTSNEEQIVKAFPAYAHSDSPAGDPPDVSVATNGTQILQVNNFLLRVFNRAGTKLIEATTATFFGPDATFTVSDPQVVYDSATGRWFVSAMEFNSGATGSKILLMVSSVSTLTNSTTWKRYVVRDDSGSVLDDQPKIGLTSDKVLLAWERFPGGSSFGGVAALAVDKAEAVSFATTVDTSLSLGGTNDFGLAPANNLSAGTTGYFVETGNPGSVVMTVLQVNGRPGDSSTFFSPAQQTMNLATASPPAADSGLSTGRIQTGDTRIQNAVWRNGVLSFVAGQGCLPYGSSGSTPTACIRLWRVATPSLSIAEDSTYSLGGAFVYTPAITYSTNGDLHMVATVSVASFLAPSMFAVGRPAGSGSWGAFDLVTDETNFDYTGIEAAPYRWGDFASAVPDPNNPTDAIIASESTDGSTGTAPNFKIVVAHVGMPLNTLTLTRSAAALTYGGSVTIVGKLMRPGGQPVVGESLQLWRQLAPASALTNYKSALTSSAGTVTFVDKPLANAHYQLQYPPVETNDGIDTFTETTLANATATVSEPVMVKVTGTENHSSIVHGHSVTFNFVVTPNEHGQTIYLQRYYSGAWHTITHHALSTTSNWLVVVTLSSIGTYRYRGYFPGNSVNAAGASPTLTVKAT